MLLFIGVVFLIIRLVWEKVKEESARIQVDEWKKQ